MQQAPIIGIQRHRLATDGEGVTTLVGFWGCPLQCKYCLNPQSWKIPPTRHYTPEKLYQEVSIDQLYFLATGGGVTFGGGEPLLYPDFMAEFRQLCGKEWNITLETSLNVSRTNLEKSLPHVNHFLIDLKESNDDIYQQYTGKSNRQVIENLKWLLQHTDSSNVHVRVPLIPEYNTIDNQHRSTTLLQELGVSDIEQFTYLSEVKKTT